MALVNQTVCFESIPTKTLQLCSLAFRKRASKSKLNFWAISVFTLEFFFYYNHTKTENPKEVLLNFLRLTKALLNVARMLLDGEQFIEQKIHVSSINVFFSSFHCHIKRLRKIFVQCFHQCQFTLARSKIVHKWRRVAYYQATLTSLAKNRIKITKMSVTYKINLVVFKEKLLLGCISKQASSSVKKNL